MVEVGHLGCVRSGHCCQRAPCAYGALADSGSGCRYLEADESGAGFTTYRCGRYEWIVANVADWRSHPAFGAGCNAPLFNPNRDAILRAKGLATALPAIPTEAEMARSIGRARDCEAQGLIAEAEAIYRGILVAHPAHVPALLRLAEIACMAQRLDHAIWLFERAIEAGADDAETHARQGAVLQQAKQFGAAVDAFGRAALRAPEQPRHRLRQAMVLTEAGAADAAVALLEPLLAAHPELAEARWALALAQRAGQPAPAKG